MFSTGHFLSGLLAFGIAKFIGLDVTLLQGFFLAVSTTLIPDLDYAIYWHKHRQSPFHTPLFGLVVLLVYFLSASTVKFAILSPFFFIMAMGIFIHILLDSIDYGIMWLYPFDKKLYGLKLLKSGPEPLKNYLKTYYSNKWMRNLEMAFLVMAAILLFV